MPTSRTFAFALAATLAAAAITGGHRNPTQGPHPGAQAKPARPAAAAPAADTVYLPGLFLDAERVAPIEPLPPQF